MSPEARLLVYYTSPEGEVVADSITVKVNEAFENEVSYTPWIVGSETLCETLVKVYITMATDCMAGTNMSFT